MKPRAFATDVGGWAAVRVGIFFPLVAVVVLVVGIIFAGNITLTLILKLNRWPLGGTSEGQSYRLLSELIQAVKARQLKFDCFFLY